MSAKLVRGRSLFPRQCVSIRGGIVDENSTLAEKGRGEAGRALTWAALRLRKGVIFALAAILTMSAAQALSVAREARPAPAMSCEAFKARLAEEIAKGGARVVDPEFSPTAVAAFGTTLARHAFSNVRDLSGDVACGADDDHFAIVEVASDVRQLGDEAIAQILRLKALAAAALGVVVDLPAPAAKRAVEGVFEAARRDYEAADLRGEISPRGYAFRDYAAVAGSLDMARIAVSFERGKIAVAVSGAE
jgi:hypothetical protein